MKINEENDSDCSEAIQNCTQSLNYSRTTALVATQTHRGIQTGFTVHTSSFWIPMLFQIYIIVRLTGTHFLFLFAFTAAGVVQCGGRKTYPRISTTVQFIFYFWSFEISVNILRNQKYVIGLDSYSGQVFNYLDPIWFISVFESIAYLKFAKLQFISSGFRCRVITGSLMRLY